MITNPFKNGMLVLEGKIIEYHVTVKAAFIVEPAEIEAA